MPENKKLPVFLRATVLVLAPLWLGGQQDRPAQYQQQPAALEMHKITEHVYEIRGGSGANAGLIATDTEALIVDAKMSMESARDMLKAAKDVTDLSVTKLLITHSDGDHVNGIPGIPDDIDLYVHGNSLKYLGEVFRSQNDEGRRTGHTFSHRLEIISGSLNVQMLHFGPAHTEGDAVIFIPQDKVAFIGDLLFIGRDPLIHKHKNGNSFGLVEVLNSILELDAEVFLHGHGRPAGRSDIEEFVNALEEKQAKIRALIEEGKSLEQIKAVFLVEDRPTQPGRAPRPSLVEIIYTEIKQTR